MKPIIDHIQITVKDMSVAAPFYDKLLPLLGFDIQKKGSAVIEEHEFNVVGGCTHAAGRKVREAGRSIVGALAGKQRADTFRNTICDVQRGVSCRCG